MSTPARVGYPVISGETGVVDTGCPPGDPRRYGAAGTGLVDDLVPLTNAIAAAGADVLLNEGAVYGISGPLDLAQGKRLVGRATIKPMSGYSANYAIQMRGATALLDIIIDGTNLPQPTANWVGTGSPKGSGVYVDASSAAIHDIRLERVAFNDIPNGGIFVRGNGATPSLGVILRECTFTNVQSHGTTFVCSAAIELYRCDDARVIDCDVDGYNWKAYNIGLCSRPKIVRSHAHGSGQQAGHAAHYESQCIDGEYLDCNHEGPGAGYKANQSTRPRLVNYVANGSALGAYFQGCSDFSMIGGEILQSTSQGKALIVEGLSGTGNADTGLIDGVIARRAVIGSTLDHIGLLLLADGATMCRNVTIRDCVFEKQYITAMMQRTNGATYDGIVFDTVRSITPKSYSLLLYAKAVHVHRCTFDRADDGQPPLVCYSIPGVDGTLWEFASNVWTTLQSTDEAAQLGYDGTNVLHCKVDQIVWRENVTDGGALALRIDLSNTAGGAGSNYCNVLNVEENTARNLASSTNGMMITFGTTNTTAHNLIGNRLYTAAKAKRSVLYANGTQCSTGVKLGNDVAALTNVPAAMGPGL